MNQPSSSSSEIATMNLKNPITIPRDILIEILSLLSVETLLKFRRVSKSWFELITHILKSSTLPRTVIGFFHPRSLCYTGSSELINIDPTLSFLSPYNRFVLVHCCNGLLLCFARAYNLRLLEEPVYFVCNPVTKSWAVLPKVEDSSPALLDFDPWVDAPRYRVLSIDKDHQCNCCSMYSSETGKWMQEDLFRGVLRWTWRTKRHVVFWKGATYAITSWGQHGHWLTKDYRLLSRLPDETQVYNRDDMLKIGMFRGLGLGLGYLDRKFKLTVWSHRGEVADQWVMEHRSSLATALRRRHKRRPRCRVDGPNIFALHPFFNVVFILYDGVVYEYDLDGMVLEEFCRPGPDVTRGNTVFPFSPCLLDVPGDDRAEKNFSLPIG